MKIEYKRYENTMFYAYNSEADITIRVSAKSKPEYFEIFGFKFDDWDTEYYEPSSKKVFNKAFNETLKKIKDIVK